jgi:hypothetical protein
MGAFEKRDSPIWVDYRHTPLKKAAVHAADRANVSNLRDSGHSIKSLPSAAMAELLSVSSHAGQPLHSETCRTNL